MILVAYDLEHNTHGIPRESGDDPPLLGAEVAYLRYSPRERG